MDKDLEILLKNQNSINNFCIIKKEEYERKGIDSMLVDAKIYTTKGPLLDHLIKEVEQYYENDKSETFSSFVPALHQIANVASLPGIVKMSIALPDIHSGYGFPIGGVAAFDLDNPLSIVSPGGVGFDINCGVRMIRTNVKIQDLSRDTLNGLADVLFDSIPSGLDNHHTSSSSMTVSIKDIMMIIKDGMKWALSKGLCTERDIEYCEDGGCIPDGNIFNSQKPAGRGMHELGSLGSGNHYLEVQVVDEIFDQHAAEIMGINEIGQLCISIHCGSRNFGHSIAKEYIEEMDKISNNWTGSQLSCAPIQSEIGQKYLQALAASANYAFVNRTILTHKVRESFSKSLGKSWKELDMELVYDVSHNIAKKELHMVDGSPKRLLVHRKGASRAFGPNHPDIPEAYKEIGQPVIVGGSMGTSSYIVVGTEKAMKETFGSTCHGSGRALSRRKAKSLNSQSIYKELSDRGIIIRVRNVENLNEEAPDAYKDIDLVVGLCHEEGISRKVVKLKPLIVMKG